MPRLTRQDFERLLEFRVTLRQFQRWSEDQAQAEGLTHVQHQLLVAIKGHHGKCPPTIGDLADVPAGPGLGPVEITRLARGITTGSVLEFANREILADAMAGRQKF